jgi:hypothetical protein
LIFIFIDINDYINKYIMNYKELNELNNILISLDFDTINEEQYNFHIINSNKCIDEECIV